MQNNLPDRNTQNPYHALRNIFARIWAIWGLISFIGTFLIVFIPAMLSYLMPELKGQWYFIRVSKVWIDIWLFLVACSVKVTGRENFKKGEVFIVVFNHNTLLDVPLSCPNVPGPNKTIAKDSFARIPLFGLYYSRGSILVNRNDVQSRRKSYDQMKKVLASGMHMCIYPEGTRNRSSEPLKTFSDGAFKLSVETNKQIIPCIILGTARSMPVKKSCFLLPTRMKMHFLPPVSPTGKLTGELKAAVFTQMREYYVENL